MNSQTLALVVLELVWLPVLRILVEGCQVVCSYWDSMTKL